MEGQGQIQHIGIQAEMEGKGVVRAKGREHLGLTWGNQESCLEVVPATSVG